MQADGSKANLAALEAGFYCCSEQTAYRNKEIQFFLFCQRPCWEALEAGTKKALKREREREGEGEGEGEGENEKGSPAS